MRVQLRDKPTAVWLAVAQGPRVDWSAYPRLDATRPDDQLVAAALTEPGDGPAELFSFDAGPLIRARMAGLAAHRSPESWALPPQQDPAEREVARLEQELATAKATRPILKARFVDAADDGTIRLLLPDLPPLPDALQERLLAEVQRQLPCEDVVADSPGPYGLGMSLGSISQAAVDRYYNEYTRFLDAYRRQFAELHELMGKALRFAEVRYEISNESHVTAARLRLALTSTDSMFLFSGRSEVEQYGGALPRIERPSAPRGAYDVSHLHHNLFHNREPRRDPTGFYWLERPKGRSAAVLTCDEFRPEQSYCNSVLALRNDAPGEARVELKISATNLAKPITVSAAVSYDAQPATWQAPEVLRRLPDWMAEIIEAEGEF
jgi:hypothetical protein